MVEQLLVHDNQLVDEQLLIQMNPDVAMLKGDRSYTTSTFWYTMFIS